MVVVVVVQSSKQDTLPLHAFHGLISSTEAEHWLTGQQRGTFLIRLSTKNASQPFAVSKVSRQGAINHQRRQHGL